MDFIWANSLDLASMAFEHEHGRKPLGRDFVLCDSETLFTILDGDIWTRSTAEFVGRSAGTDVIVCRFRETGREICYRPNGKE